MGVGVVWLGRLTPVAIRGRYQIRFNAYSAQAGHARSGGFGSCGHLEEIARRLVITTTRAIWRHCKLALAVKKDARKKYTKQ